MLRIPHCLDNRLTYGSRVASSSSSSSSSSSITEMSLFNILELEECHLLECDAKFAVFFPYPSTLKIKVVCTSETSIYFHRNESEKTLLFVVTSVKALIKFILFYLSVCRHY
jgi:hypothetical protein